MLFSAKLSSETYAPWKQSYIAYDQLKKLLKESVAPESEWTEEDESRFVQLLDKELDKVCGFETKKYEEISERLSKIENKVTSATNPAGKESPKLNKDLEQILDDTTRLDKFRRLNYTAFVKIVRKHDRIHSEYRVMPLLQARLRSVPFHSEDYSPLLRRLSSVYTFIDKPESPNEDSDAARHHKFNSIDKDVNANHSNGYVTLQFWVHPDNLMEVKTLILRKLPVLVYNREDDDEDNEHDPIVTSLYLDNRKFTLYHSLLERDPASDQTLSSSLRFRWYGRLFERPEIVLEQHNELDGRITRVVLKEKTVDKFLSGDASVMEKQARKMRERHVHSRAIEEFLGAATELQKFIADQKLEPLLRTVYRRTAFEIPGDDRVRVILDQDIVFMREDSLNQSRPVRDPSTWHRTELDQPGIDPMSMVRKGEFARFPYSVLEVRLKVGAESGDVGKLHWIDDLEKSKLIKKVPHFTKFLHGVSVLYGEDEERLDILPFWLSEFESSASKDHQKQPTTSSSSDHAQHQPIASSSQSKAPHLRRARSYKFDVEDDEFDSDDSGVLDPAVDALEEEEEAERGNMVGYPTRISKLGDEDSEDEEVNLPSGVERPSEWIKNQSSPKVEAKVWLANERTFNRWLHTTCLLSALTFTLYSSVDSATNSSTATLVAYILFGLTVFSAVWGYSQYMLRIKYIRERGNRPMDSPLGPIIVSVGLLVALIINFTALYSKSGSELQELASAANSL